MAPEPVSSSPERCQCKTSTGIDGSITRGTGKLDDFGYWEFPCGHTAQSVPPDDSGTWAGMEESGAVPAPVEVTRTPVNFLTIPQIAEKLRVLAFISRIPQT
jgi:hypothetical protein